MTLFHFAHIPNHNDLLIKLIFTKISKSQFLRFRRRCVGVCECPFEPVRHRDGSFWRVLLIFLPRKEFGQNVGKIQGRRNCKNWVCRYYPLKIRKTWNWPFYVPNWLLELPNVSKSNFSSNFSLETCFQVHLWFSKKINVFAHQSQLDLGWWIGAERGQKVKFLFETWKTCFWATFCS